MMIRNLESQRGHDDPDDRIQPCSFIVRTRAAIPPGDVMTLSSLRFKLARNTSMACLGDQALTSLPGISHAVISKNSDVVAYKPSLH
ncbi:MAG TPA: hypothetical protein PLW35_03770 [Verrucomicrobiota bacterium]|nr:hypothetical protein [Verrucomicrobiota bacterium]